MAIGSIDRAQVPADALDIRALAAEFTATHPELDPAHQRFALAIFRLLGEGEPFGTRELAERTELPPDEVASRTANDLGRASEPSTVPTGVAVFPGEPSLPVRRLAERTHNIVRWSEFDRGGHFPAMEVPELLVGDLREFFRRLR